MLRSSAIPKESILSTKAQALYAVKLNELSDTNKRLKVYQQTVEEVHKILLSKLKKEVN